MTMSSQGSCNYDGAQSEGTQPSSDDMWGVAEWANTINHSGIALRTKNADMTGTEYFYVARNQTDTIQIFRICDGDNRDADCATMGANFNHGIEEVGMRQILAVAGSGDDTVLCVKYFPAADSTDYCDPSNWSFNFQRCLNDDGTPTNDKLDAYIDCGGDTQCDGWDEDGPDNNKGFPASGQLNVRWYHGTTGGASVANVCGGDL